jgi:hypothetical protein
MKRDFRMASLSSYHSPRSLWIASAHACRHHLADLKAAGHSPRSTELHNPSDGGAPVSFQREQLLSLVGASAASCAEG